MKKTKRDYKNWLVINTEDYLKKKNMLETDIVICLKKTKKTKTTHEKPSLWYLPSRHKTSWGRPLKVVLLTSGTYRRPLGDFQGTNSKTDNLMKKLCFRSKSPCITYLFLFFTGRTNIQKFLTGTCTGRLRDPVAGRRSNMIFKLNSQTE